MTFTTGQSYYKNLAEMMRGYCQNDNRLGQTVYLPIDSLAFTNALDDISDKFAISNLVSELYTSGLAIRSKDMLQIRIAQIFGSTLDNYGATGASLIKVQESNLTQLCKEYPVVASKPSHVFFRVQAPMEDTLREQGYGYLHLTHWWYKQGVKALPPDFVPRGIVRKPIPPKHLEFHDEQNNTATNFLKHYKLGIDYFITSVK